MFVVKHWPSSGQFVICRQLQFGCIGVLVVFSVCVLVVEVRGVGVCSLLVSD